jgi:hypothetical protein
MNRACDFSGFGEAVLDRPAMNVFKVHVHLMYTVLFEALWFTANVKLDVVGIKVDSEKSRKLRNDIVDEHREQQWAEN